MDVPNPLMPVPIGVVFAGVAALALILTVAALVSLFARTPRPTSADYVWWTLVILFVPLVGASLWFRETHRTAPRPTDERSADDGGRRP